MSLLLIKTTKDDLKIPTYLNLYLEILAAATLNGFIYSSNIFTDSTYIKASANKKKYEYVHDEYYDCYICPNNKILKYSTTNRDGYRKYKSNPGDCKDCKYIKIYTNSKNQYKVVTRHIWQDYIDKADYLRHKTTVKKIIKKERKLLSVFLRMQKKSME